jgi:hypothetical protein
VTITQDRLILMREMFNAWEQTHHKDEVGIGHTMLWKIGYNLGNDPFYDPPDRRLTSYAYLFCYKVFLRYIF